MKELRVCRGYCAEVEYEGSSTGALLSSHTYFAGKLRQSVVLGTMAWNEQTVDGMLAAPVPMAASPL